jgi:hypothetical protein
MKTKTLIIILISVIVILLAILIYGVYTGFKAKAIINSMQTEINQLNQDKIDLNSQLKSLQNQYNLLQQDVAKIYKGCIKENACKGHYPGVRWYCNNVGDEVTDHSHTCVCDSGCNLNATEIKK